MSFVTAAYAALFYLATVVLVAGLVSKIASYAKTPAPLKIPTTPAPTTTTGVVIRMAGEVGLFWSLLRSNKLLWVLAVLFHAGLALALLRHFRYFQQDTWFWVDLVQPFGIYGGMAMVVGLFGLLGRRFVIDRVKYITGPSDILMLLLLIGIGISGLSMKFVAHTDIISVKAFFLGLMTFNIQPLPTDPNLLVHLLLVATLMIVFPFSKLLHVPGVFFSPTRNQVDNPREKRHLAPWAAPLDATRDE